MKCDDGTLREDSMLIEFTTLVTQALAPRGINWIVGNDMEEILRNAGFVNIQYKKFKTPIGMWPKVLQALSNIMNPVALLSLT